MAKITFKIALNLDLPRRKYSRNDPSKDRKPAYLS